ncbi:MAG: dienelactone hydrolase family protein [Marinobacter sp.]|nr:dienelactone hydrolase family protein [Marinobacter sp.]
MSEKWVEISVSGNGAFSGYLVLPPKGTGPGIVLVQEIWGVNRHIRLVAEQYALAGYVVLAPDVFWRQERRVELTYDQAGSARARKLRGGLDDTQAGADVSQAAEYLRARPEVEGKVGAVGFCLGGQLAYRAAATGSVDVAVAYYGGGIAQNLDLADQIEQPFLFHHAEHDSLIPLDAVHEIKQRFEGHGNTVFFEYPGVDHGFNCSERPAYDQKAAALAHGRTLVFLSQNL